MSSNRYDRQTILPGIGEQGQKRLGSSRVLCVGAGGLGSPAALYLAAAGVGVVGLIDGDVVDESNLQRQILFSTAQIGEPKASAAAARLRALNPHVQVVSHDCWLDHSNALEILGQYDVIVDGTDNFAAKYLINDAAAILGLPVVYGSLSKHEGRASVFWAKRGPCYRCLYPLLPRQPIANCAEAGVLGALAGMIGSMQALEAVKICLGDYFKTLLARLLVVDATNLRFFEHPIPKNPGCTVCSIEAQLIKLHPLEQVCQTTTFSTDNLLLDVRTKEEWQQGHLPNALSWPLDLLEKGQLPELNHSKHCVVYCQAGVRSRRAAELLAKHGFKNVSTLAGGLNARKEHGL